MLRVSALLIICLAASQAADSRPNRFGSVGRGLTDAEVVQITRLASTAGKPPWLVIGFPSMISGLATVTLYLEPDVTDAPVHRGRMLHLIADEPPSVPQRSAWRVKATGSYARIVVVPDRRASEITDERDIGWPFAVEGEIEDETLISAVAFIRSKPKIPGVPEGQAPREVGGAPISAVARRDNHFIVALRTSEATGQRVTLTRRDGQWVITPSSSGSYDVGMTANMPLQPTSGASAPADLRRT
jgi:hypothetical protein